MRKSKIPDSEVHLSKVLDLVKKAPLSRWEQTPWEGYKVTMGRTVLDVSPQRIRMYTKVSFLDTDGYDNLIFKKTPQIKAFMKLGRDAIAAQHSKEEEKLIKNIAELHYNFERACK